MPLKKLLTLSVVAGFLAASGPAWSQTPADGTFSHAPAPGESPPAPSPPAQGLLLTEHCKHGTRFRYQGLLHRPAALGRERLALVWRGARRIGAAHHYDTDVRKHFTQNLAPGQSVNSDDVHDAIPTAAIFVATWGYANLVGSSAGRSEAWSMLEAAGLSGVTAYALKYAGGREGPDQTSNPNEWLKGSGGSFPSFHSTAAFAVGTVLAESGNDDYRWLRRLLGYGLGVATSYERLKHNQHWLSDTVAGAALGTASARFTMNRTYASGSDSNLALVPVEGGAMLTYRSLP